MTHTHRRARALISFLALAVIVTTLSALTTGSASAATTKLAAPTKVRAVTAGSGKAVVTWEGIYGASRFRVRYGPTTTMTTAAGAFALDTTANETHKVLTGLTAGKKYYFQVESLAATGSTAYSSSTYTALLSFVASANGSLDDFGVMSYNILCADYCVESSRHNIDTFPWLKRRARLVENIQTSVVADIIGLQEAGGYVATGWNCRTSPTNCSTPKKLTPDGTDGAYDRFCTVLECPVRVEGGKFDGTPRQIDDIMRFLPDFGITAIAGDPNAKETGFSYLRIMWRKSTFDLVREGDVFDIDGDQYESNLRWHRKAYWAVVRQKSTGRSYFVVTAHPVSTGGVNTAEGYPSGADASAVRAAGTRKMLSTINGLNTGNLPVIIAGDMNTASSSDGSLTVLRDAGYVNTRTSVSSSQRINDNVSSYNGFNPVNMVASGTANPYDYVFVHPAVGGNPIKSGMAWVQAPVRGKYVYNCRSTASVSSVPTAGCWGADHFPLIAQIWEAP